MSPGHSLNKPLHGVSDVPPDMPSDHPVVLIVDDHPDNLALLSSTLSRAGYVILVALDGQSALDRIERVIPDVILMDAMMPGMDGFETCARIKASTLHRHIPVIFMTALTDSHHVVNGFRAGGVDYVTKPIRPDEVVARIAAHVSRAASQRHVDIVLELGSRAAVIATANGVIQWHSVLAPRQLGRFFPPSQTATAEPAALTMLPDKLRDWLTLYTKIDSTAPDAMTAVLPGGDRLVAKVVGAATRGSWIVIFEEHSDQRDIAALAAQFSLTRREAEVLLWLSRGKTNRDIGDILDMMPRTVNKHLERIFIKISVETRTAAVAAALKAIQWAH